MSIKVESMDGTIQKIGTPEYKERKVNAYRAGTMGAIKKGMVYRFKEEAYLLGIEHDKRLRDELAAGLR